MTSCNFLIIWDLSLNFLDAGSREFLALFNVVYLPKVLVIFLPMSKELLPIGIDHDGGIVFFFTKGTLFECSFYATNMSTSTHVIANKVTLNVCYLQSVQTCCMLSGLNYVYTSDSLIDHVSVLQFYIHYIWCS